MMAIQTVLLVVILVLIIHYLSKYKKLNILTINTEQYPYMKLVYKKIQYIAFATALRETSCSQIIYFIRKLGK